MKHRGLGTILLALPLSTAGFALPVGTVEASANSAAQKWEWEGADGVGAILAGDQCPIEVESEHLTFSLSEFPKMLLEGDIEEFQTYGGKFKAEYTFFNPDKYDYNLKLVFPLGAVPEYYPYSAEEYDRTKLGYAIEKDGESIDFTIRHTLNGMPRYGKYDLEQGIAQLYPTERKFYRDDLPVTIYNYLVQVPKQGTQSYDRVNFALSFDASAERTRIFCSDYCNYSVNNGKAKLVHSFDCAQEEALEFSVYVIGEDISEPESGVYRYDKTLMIEDEGARVTLVSTQRDLTFADLALTFRKEGSPVSESDWKNAFIDYIEKNKNSNSCYSNIKPAMFGSAFDFMEWFEYSLTIPAGERVKNSVSAPIYPTIDSRYEQELYHYTYLLSPAQKWAKFGQLTVDIDTPYYISDTSLVFEKREGGYTLTRDRLPLCELTFTLSDGEPTVTPEPDRPPYQGTRDSNRGLIAGIIILCVVAGGAAVVSIVLAMLSKKKKKRREEEERRLLQTRAQEGTIDLPDADKKSSE